MNREIAEHLVLAERTLRSHPERIFAKLHMTSRARLSACVTERALVRALGGAGTATKQPEEPVTSAPERR